MKYLILSVVALFALGSCSPAEVSLPLPKDQLTEVLIDIHLAEAAVQELPVDRRDTVLRVLYAEILQQHGLDSATFDSAIVLIRKQPKLMDGMYTSILDSLRVMGIRAGQPATDR